jgi:thiol-disulfide isomerase/thioredoxin
VPLGRADGEEERALRGPHATRRGVASLAAATALLLGACGAPPPPEGGAAGDRAEAAGSGARQAPDFTARTLEGEPFRLSETGGRVRLIDFWATWCAPCREEVPLLNELEETYGSHGFLVLAITEEDAEDVREFVEEHGVRYTNLVGAAEVAESYRVLGLPSAYLLDPDGKIVDSWIGPKPREVLIRKIRTLLGEPSAT